MGQFGETVFGAQVAVQADAVGNQIETLFLVRRDSNSPSFGPSDECRVVRTPPICDKVTSAPPATSGKNLAIVLKNNGVASNILNPANGRRPWKSLYCARITG